jgi:hypothetical protein
VTLAAAAVLLAIVTLAVPGTRSSVASWFDVPGIRLEIGPDDEQVRTPPASIGGTLLLGQPVTMGEAAAVAPFAIVAPDGERIASTPETYLLRRDGAVIVSLLYPASTGLPEIGTTGVGLLLMQIDSAESSQLLVKRTMGEQSPVSVTVNGEAGTWIAGGTLAVEPVYETGAFERSSGNVLIWERSGVTYRMESALGMPDAVALAERLEPVPVTRTSDS